MANGNGNGNGSKVKVRNPFVSSILDEVDVRIARLLGGIDDAAERIAETVQQVDAEIARDERTFRRGFGTSSGASPFGAAIDLGRTPAGAGLLVTSVSFFNAANNTASGVIFANDPNASDFNFAVFGVPNQFGSLITAGLPCEFYIPENTPISARVYGSAGNQSVGAIVHGRLLSVEP